MNKACMLRWAGRYPIDLFCILYGSTSKFSSCLRTGSVAPSGLLPETDSSPSEREVVHAPVVDTHVHEVSVSS